MKLKTKRILIFAAVQLSAVAAVIALMLYKNYSARTGFDPLRMCVMHDLLHLYCPGCGGTRAVYSLLNLDILKAFLYNPFVPYIAAVYAYLSIRAAISIMRDEKTLIWWHKSFTWITLLLPVAFFILRNVLLVFFGYDYIGDLAQYWI